MRVSFFLCTFAVANEFTMEDNFAIQLFEGKKVRIVWDEEQEKYFLGLPQILICGKRRNLQIVPLGLRNTTITFVAGALTC